MPTSTEEAAAFVFRSLKPAAFAKTKPSKISEKDEVTFRNPKDAEKIFIDYTVSNLPNLIVALSLNAPVFDEAKFCRHFFAHRTKNTGDTVETFARSLGIVNFSSTEELLLTGRPSTGVRLLEGWLADVENFFDYAT